MKVLATVYCVMALIAISRGVFLSITSRLYIYFMLKAAIQDKHYKVGFVPLWYVWVGDLDRL